VTVVTDTHPWIWFFTGSPRLSNHAKSILSDRANTIIVPSIVMLEIKYLYLHKRIMLSFEVTLQKIESCDNILVYPLDISIASVAPTSLDIHDAIIVGTSIQASEEFGQPVSLVTLDKAIAESQLIPIIW